MSRLSIAIISDLHIGKHACSPDLRGEVAWGGHSGFIRQFERFVRSEAIQPDLLLVPGDMGEQANPDEFDRASQLVLQVASLLNVSEERIICIPGNHDVDWSVLNDQPPIHPVRLRQRYDPILNPDNIFYRSFSRAVGDLFQHPHFAVWQMPEVICIGYNSSWHDGPGRAHNGNLNLDDLRQLRSWMETNSVDRFGGVKTFVVHHHLFQYPTFFWEDTSIAQNAEELLELLAEFKFDILVHGHRHVPKFLVQRRHDLHPLVALGAGTFSHRIDTELQGMVANQFHLMRVEGRNAEGAIYGRTLSWAYLPSDGWQPSYTIQERDRQRRRGTGINHDKSFGGYANQVALEGILRGVIAANLTDVSPIVNLTDLMADDVQFCHTTEELLDGTLVSLGREMGFSHFRPTTVANQIMIARSRP